jgi:hypothetical protein
MVLVIEGCGWNGWNARRHSNISNIPVNNEKHKLHDIRFWDYAVTHLIPSNNRKRSRASLGHVIAILPRFRGFILTQRRMLTEGFPDVSNQAALPCTIPIRIIAG